MPLQVDLDGLVCHVGPDGDPKSKTHAVLVQSTAHTADISVNARYRTDPTLGDFTASLHPGDDISFAGSDLGSGAASTTTAFDQLVPSLLPVLEDANPANRDLETDVKGRKPHSHVRTYVTYYPGTLDAVGPLEFMLRLETSAGVLIKEVCVADESRLTCQNTAPVTLTVKHRGGQPDTVVDLVADAVVLIRNRGKKHFQRYREITRASGIAATSRGGACQAVKKARGGPADPECTNSSWP